MPIVKRWVMATVGFVAVLAQGAVLFGSDEQRTQEPAKLLAHWPLREDARDVVGSAHGKPVNVKFADGAAIFNGRDSRIDLQI